MTIAADANVAAPLSERSDGVSSPGGSPDDGASCAVADGPKCRRPGNATACFATGAVMLTFLVAGAAKLWDLSTFARSLTTWSLIPRGLVPAVAILVPSSELIVGAAWFLGLRRRLAGTAALFLLCAFTLAFAAHALLGRPPDCKCFGKLLDFQTSVSDARTTIARNLALICLLVLGHLLGPAAARAPYAEPERPSRLLLRAGGRATRPGFTIVETILTVALMGILLALSLPSLSNVRRGASATVWLSNLRTHAATFSAYSNDFAGRLPFFTYPEATYTVLRHEAAVVEARFFWTAFYWNFALADGYYDGQLLHSTFGSSQPFGPAVDFWYSQVFVADPQYWNPTTRIGRSQWRAVGMHEVSFPSQKGLLINAWPVRNRAEMQIGSLTERPTQVALVDGGARSVRPGQFAKGYAGTAGQPVESGLFPGIPCMTTLDGSRGRDLR